MLTILVRWFVGTLLLAAYSFCAYVGYLGETWTIVPKMALAGAAWMTIMERWFPNSIESRLTDFGNLFAFAAVNFVFHFIVGIVAYWGGRSVQILL